MGYNIENIYFVTKRQNRICKNNNNRSMTDTEFITLVRAMREAQKNFFATRNANYLKQSKELEKQVDNILNPKPPDTQKRMF
jgi:hypothetical protein